MKMKKLVAWMLVIVMAIAMSGCGKAEAPAAEEPAKEEAKTEEPAEEAKTEEPAEEPAKSEGPTMVGTDEIVEAADFDTDVTPNRKYTIAVVVKSAAAPVWESHIIAAKKAGEKIGVEILDFSPSKADNVEEQKRILEDLITMGVDAVVLAPANTDAVKGPVQDLIDAGIPVVYDNTMGPSDVDYLSYVGVDNEKAGAMMADKMAELIGGKGNIVVMEGVPGQSTSDVRTKGCIERLESEYPDITYETVVTQWQIDEGRKVAEDYITKWGDDLKGLIAVGGNQGEGAVEAIQAAGLEGKVFVNGFDLQEPQYAAVENGSEAFTMSQGVYEQAYFSVIVAVRALNGEEVPRSINCPLTVVTKENLVEMDERPEALKQR